ncbi:response regulator [Thermodesulfobacteriota bacterium]
MARLLVIDDDDQFREMLREMLIREGYQVETAPEGETGIRLYRNAPFDLIITDIIMPEKEGVETIMELKRNFPEVKIIAVSGGGQIGPRDYLEMAKKLGADRTFSKPLLRVELLDAVKEVLE